MGGPLPPVVAHLIVTAVLLSFTSMDGALRVFAWQIPRREVVVDKLLGLAALPFAVGVDVLLYVIGARVLDIGVVADVAIEIMPVTFAALLFSAWREARSGLQTIEQATGEGGLATLMLAVFRQVERRDTRRYAETYPDAGPPPGRWVYADRLGREGAEELVREARAELRGDAG